MAASRRVVPTAAPRQAAVALLFLRKHQQKVPVSCSDASLLCEALLSAVSFTHGPMLI